MSHDQYVQEEEEANRVIPLLENYTNSTNHVHETVEHEENQLLLPLRQRVWIESKKLWRIVGPAITSRLLNNVTLVITQALAGHLGELELAAVSIAMNVFIIFDVGLLIGMASALETLCGQAFGAKKHYMLGTYLQRSWVVLFICCVLILPVFLFSGSILKLVGESSELAELAGVVTIWLIPLHFGLAFFFPIVKFLQCQIRNSVTMWVSAGAAIVHLFVSWLFIFELKLGVRGSALTLDIAWWLMGLSLFCYAIFGGCPNTWTGFSLEAFSDLWEFAKLSVSSGVMLCLENWYYGILILIAGNMTNAELVVDALTICMTINTWEMRIPLAFFTGTGVRVANELGAENGSGAKFATIVSASTSVLIGIFFAVLIAIFLDDLALIFTSSESVITQVHNLSFLLASAILLNSIQPVLSGVAVGSGWQKYVAFINLGCYYLLGLPLGILLGLVFDFGIKGIWAGMIFGGTGVQTVILVIIVVRCDWEKEAQNASMRMKQWEQK